MDDGRRDTLQAEPVPPPAPHELRLIDNLSYQPRAEQCQQTVAVLGAQEVTRTGGEATVQPIDAVQALHEADATTPYPQQAPQVPHAAGEEHCLVGHICEAIADLNTAPR